MIYTKIEQLTVGTVFYQERTHIGFVEFKVIKRDGLVANVTATSITLFDFELDQEKLNNYNQRGLHLYDTLQSAREDKQHKENEIIESYIEEYGEDKESFTVMVLKLAYEYTKDEDYVKGRAIKELASIHFPSIEL